MIQPANAQEARYVLNQAALLVRANDQSVAGDEGGSKQLMAAYRSLKDMGERTYKARNRGLLEYVALLAREEPRSERLLRFMERQDEQLAQVKVDATDNEYVATDGTHVYRARRDVVADDDILGIEPEPIEVPEPPKPKRVRKPRAKKIPEE